MQETQKKKCGAKTRSGKPCQTWAMDNGRCRMHSGRNIDDTRERLPGRPIVHGMSSKYMRGVLADVAQKYLEDKDFLSLKEEIALSRAMLERYSSMLGNTKPTADEVKSFFLITDSIRRLSDTFLHIETNRKLALNPDEVLRIMRQVADIIKKHVVDEVVYDRIKEEIMQIRI